MAIYRNYGTDLKKSLSGGFDEVPGAPLGEGGYYYSASPIPCKSWTSLSPDWEGNDKYDAVWRDGRVCFDKKA